MCIKKNPQLLLLALFVFFIGLGNTGVGQKALAQTEEISLSEALTQGLENNFALIISRKHQQISENNYTLGNAGFLPRVGLQSQAGTQIQSGTQYYRDGDNHTSSGIVNSNANAGLQLNWTVFDGFRVRAQYHRLGELQAMGELQTRLSVENFAGRLASEYYYYVQQLQLLENLQFAVDLSKERLRIEEEHFSLGSGSKVSLLQSQVYLNADSSRLERQYEVIFTSRIRLNELMASSDLDRAFIPKDTLMVLRETLVFEDLKQKVLENNASLLMASSDINVSQHDLRIAQSVKYPYLSLNSGYGYNYNSFGSGNIERQNALGFNAGITLSFTLYDGGNIRRQEQNALIRKEVSQLSYDQLLFQVKADLLSLHSAYLNNLRILDMEMQNLEVARENLDIAFERYRLGALSGFELREVQKNLLEAEERLLSVQYQVKIAEISLMQISGRILDYI